MPMDFNYTDNIEKYPHERHVFHALFACPEARKIKNKHREYGLPPADQQRSPCKVCVAEARAWLGTT